MKLLHVAQANCLWLYLMLWGCVCVCVYTISAPQRDNIYDVHKNTNRL